MGKYSEGTAEDSERAMRDQEKVKNYKGLVSINKVRQLCMLAGNDRSQNSVFLHRRSTFQKNGS